ncbi:hypothetical protein ADK55_07895 [Streptomyces sp. WM4235]|nr:hypothetical protein ADK55_07895 [Streptomyces sp. WM4235]
MATGKVKGWPVSASPAFGSCVQTFQFDSWRTLRLCTASFTVMLAFAGSVERAAFIPWPTKFGMTSPAGFGAGASVAGQASSSLTAPKSTAVLVSMPAPGPGVWLQTSQFRSRAWSRSRPSASCDLRAKKPARCALASSLSKFSCG